MPRITNPIYLLVAFGLLLFDAGCGNDATEAPLPSAPAIVDTAPPIPPTGLLAEVGFHDVKLRWEPNLADPDFRGFTLTRTAAGADVAMLADPVNTTVFVDTHPFTGLATYTLCAVDGEGNVSAACVLVVDTSIDHVPSDITVP